MGNNPMMTPNMLLTDLKNKTGQESWNINQFSKTPMHLNKTFNQLTDFP